MNQTINGFEITKEYDNILEEILIDVKSDTVTLTFTANYKAVSGTINNKHLSAHEVTGWKSNKRLSNKELETLSKVEIALQEFYNLYG